MTKKTVGVVGAGIVGLAVARAFALKGFEVKVFDKSPEASGASIRNFGMIWPIGQPAPKLYSRAIRTRNIWQEIATETGLWYNSSGSLHLAYTDEEFKVIQELATIFSHEGRDISLIEADKISQEFPYVNPHQILGGLWSREEALIDPREAMSLLPKYLQDKYQVHFYWNHAVSRIQYKTLYIGNEKSFSFDLIMICSGADFETLYPEEFLKLPITKCKLQMMRTSSQTPNYQMRTPVCGGLSLLHYKSFESAPSLPKLREKMNLELSSYIKHGIHVMACQNGLGEITIGDNHEYGHNPSPFDKGYIQEMILRYLNTFLKIDSTMIAESWHGIYPKLTNGDTETFFSPDKDVHILNGLGGNGMTLSLGLAEEVVDLMVK